MTLTEVLTRNLLSNRIYVENNGRTIFPILPLESCKYECETCFEGILLAPIEIS